jgi:hypothetical protein
MRCCEAGQRRAQPTQRQRSYCAEADRRQVEEAFTHDAADWEKEVGSRQLHHEEEQDAPGEEGLATSQITP